VVQHPRQSWPDVWMLCLKEVSLVHRSQSPTVHQFAGEAGGCQAAAGSWCGIWVPAALPAKEAGTHCPCIGRSLTPVSTPT
jgi:hypothetical protein